jgi:hypothetical protein
LKGVDPNLTHEAMCHPRIMLAEHLSCGLRFAVVKTPVESYWSMVPTQLSNRRMGEHHFLGLQSMDTKR